MRLTLKQAQAPALAGERLFAKPVQLNDSLEVQTKSLNIISIHEPLDLSNASNMNAFASCCAVVGLCFSPMRSLINNLQHEGFKLLCRCLPTALECGKLKRKKTWQCNYIQSLPGSPFHNIICTFGIHCHCIQS